MNPEIEAFVQQPYLAVLSTVSASGRPQSTVLWYVFEQGAFWFNVGKDSQKARNIRRSPHVSLTIDERTWPYKSAVIYGQAEEVAFDEEQALRIAVRYVGREDGSAMHRAMMAGEERVRMRLLPDRVAWMDFSGWDYKSLAGQ